MVRRVFFSFHYEQDSWRAGQVRNSWIGNPNRTSAGYIDGAEWEEVKEQGDAAIERWIQEQMDGCSVTVVLIGSDTYGRKWIDHEIEKSVEEGMGLVGVRIHNIKDENRRTDSFGLNPLSKRTLGNPGEKLSNKYNTYDWKHDNGRENIGDWVEKAAKTVDR